MKVKPLTIIGVILVILSVVVLKVFGGYTEAAMTAFAGVVIGAVLATIDFAKQSKYGIKSWKTWLPILVFVVGIICTTVGGVGEKTLMLLIGAVVAIVGIVIEIILNRDNK